MLEAAPPSNVPLLRGPGSCAPTTCSSPRPEHIRRASCGQPHSRRLETGRLIPGCRPCTVYCHRAATRLAFDADGAVRAADTDHRDTGPRSDASCLRLLRSLLASNVSFFCRRIGLVDRPFRAMDRVREQELY